MKLEDKVELLEGELEEARRQVTKGVAGELSELVRGWFVPPKLSRESSVLDFSRNLAASEDPDALEEKMPWDGYVMSAIINWPEGCKNLAGVRITIDGKRVAPKNEQWISLNGVTIRVPVVQKVRKGRLIKVKFKNNDILKTHYLTVLVGIYNYFPEQPIMNVL